MNNEFFNQEAVESFCGTDDLTKTIKMTTPGVWMIGLSCLFLILGILFWGIFGVISTHIETTGMIQNDKVICTFTGWTGTGLSEASTSVTIPSGSTGNREYTANWSPISYTVTFDVEEGDPEKYRGKPLSIRVTTEHTSPIGLIFER